MHHSYAIDFRLWSDLPPLNKPLSAIWPFHNSKLNMLAQLKPPLLYVKRLHHLIF